MDEQRQAWAAACVEATRRLESASDDPEHSIFLSLTQREAYLIRSILLMSLANGLPDAGATKLLDKIQECLDDAERSAWENGASTSSVEEIEALALVCADCGETSDPAAAGWRAYIDSDGEAVTFCPQCAEREFGDR